MRLGGKGAGKPKGKRGSLLERVGLQTERVATPSEERDKSRDETIKKAWLYLRGRIDKGIRHYYQTGSWDKLDEFVDRPALDALKQELHTLRQDDIYWEQPDREVNTSPHLTVIDVKTDAEERPIEFVVRERFEDFSVLSHVDGGVATPIAHANGDERVMEVTVSVRDGSKFKLRSVRQVSDATLS
jgi:hypothetical protein